MSATDVNGRSVTLSPTWGDVVQEVQARHPLILHFACHSDGTAIKLFHRELAPEIIFEALQSHNEEAKRSGKERVQIVVFNACFSNEHAEKLKHVVDFAIGHNGALDDEDAIDFAHCFYSCLFKGRTLFNCMQIARGCSRSCGYELHSIRNADSFRLAKPEEQAKGLTAGEEPAMVQFFKDSGLEEIAGPLCEELRIKNWKFEYLVHLNEESLDMLRKTKMYPHEKKLFWQLVSNKLKELSVCTPRLCPPAGDATELSEASTLSEPDISDASDFEDDSFPKEMVIARNVGDKESFEIHVACFLQEFGKFSGNLQTSVDERNSVMQIEEDGKGPHDWTMCMLLWLKVVKDARMQEGSREQWQESLSSPSQGKLLQTLDTMLCGGDVEYKYWDAAKLAVSRCKKTFASVVFLTHELVRACLPSDDCCRQQWDQRVMRDWNASLEDANQILRRMNKFLWSQVQSIQVITNVIETGSYVCYISMHKITAMILFEYLETYKRVKSGTQSDSDTSSLFQGFCMFASSSARFFSLQEIGIPRLREIITKLRIFTRLPNSLLLLLGPARRVQGLLGEHEKSILTKHQTEKAWECEQAMMMERGVHVQGPSGTGKTIMALHIMLRVLQKDETCSVLYFLPSEHHVHIVAQWISCLASRDLVNDRLFDRISFCLRGARGWDGPFWMTETERKLKRKRGEEVPVHEEASEYKLVVMDEAHHIFCDPEAAEYMRTRQYDEATMMLISDSSQATVTDISYPDGLRGVHLTEIVEISQRAVTEQGGLNALECEKPFHVEVEKENTVGSHSEHLGQTQNSSLQLQEAVPQTIKEDETGRENVGGIKDEKNMPWNINQESSWSDTTSSSCRPPAIFIPSLQSNLSNLREELSKLEKELKQERESRIRLQEWCAILKEMISKLEQDLRAEREARARLEEEADQYAQQKQSSICKLKGASFSQVEEANYDTLGGEKFQSHQKIFSCSDRMHIRQHEHFRIAACWTLPPGEQAKLKESFDSIGAKYKGLTLSPGSELCLELGLSNYIIGDVADKASTLEEYARLVEREWELANKEAAPGRADMQRRIAQEVPGRFWDPPMPGMLQDEEARDGRIVAKHAAESKTPRTRITNSLEKVGGYNSKFSMEEGSEAIYGALEEFHGGLVQRVGLPSKLEDLRQGMEEEHCSRADSEQLFTPPN
eukprot:754516-Hanusia_phi.AAC.1